MLDQIQFQTKHFQDLRVDELYELLQLRSEIFVVEQNCIYNDLDSKDQNSLHLMGIYKEKIVAYARLVPVGVSYPKYCSIGRVVVAAEVRGNQIGYLLMNKAIQETKKLFSEPIKISAQAHLEQFYNQVGFANISAEPYLEDNIPHIAMTMTEK